MEIINAKILGSELGGRSDVFTARVHVDVKGIPESFSGHDYKFILKMVDIVSVPTWEHLRGKFVRIKWDGKKIQDLGHIVDEKWVNI